MEFHSGSGNPDNDVLKSSRINVAQCAVAKYFDAFVSDGTLLIFSVLLHNFANLHITQYSYIKGS